ncbi:flocculation protein FLO11-like isoform X2 [Frieseomelitta varia]|uniref:flocculation protein FLO11-like isoform X2 n=1 Tax=Frieseomelitta varia TaxID=561572 RepID=UPI001CB6ADB5|nr:flocculation protein FLO11-like isoform X2 [Frieseomelitta varia]
MNWESRTVSLLLCLSILLATIHNGNAERKIVCYYTNWSIYRPGTAKFSPQNINPYLCTHLIYAFGGFTKDNALKPFDKYQDIEKGGYAKFTGLKTYNKNLKTLLAVGGWNEGSSRFSPMVADPGRRREFVKNAVKFLRKNHFDGLDLDWEYPAFRDGGKPRDKDNYASLVQELREEFEREASKTGRPRLLLTMAMPAGVEYIDKGYDVPRLNEHLDFINLLSYDYHSSYEPAVDHHSPLYPLEEDNEYNYDAELTIDYTVKYLSKKGAAPEKIVLGIPTYGRSYTLFNEDATDLGSPADGPGVEGEATREKGYLAYYEICEGLAQSDEWEVIQPNPKAMGPYAYKGDQWVGYDDESIVRLKARYVNEKNLGGIMFWTIDNDDFRGRCHGRPYPLIEAAKEALLTDSSNIIQRSKTTVDNRKKPRVHGVQGDTAGRKSFRRGSGKSTTTAAPPPRTRVFSPRPSYRTFSRPKASEEEKEEERSVDRRSYDSTSSVDEEGSSEGGNAVRAASKNGRPGSKSKRRPSKDRSSRNRTKQIGNNDSSEGSLSNRLTTPEPPTTPDPGTDFKCEDEGFFPHPRDCKKYFWCLESGPGGLGVIAHQFTCPSGLVFNKAADSCDYPRNVICPKSKTSQSAASTPRAPIVAATSRTTFLYSTTRRPPSTEKPDTEEEEYEYYDDEDDEQTEEEEAKEKEEKEEREATSTTPKALLYKTISRSRPTTSTTTTEAPFERNEPDKLSDVEENEEDPKVIKELIMLIKKAGGIEQLEKQLLLQDKNPENESGAKSGNENATPATISRSLYERVLSRQAGKITSRQRANGPGSAQFEGLDELPEVKGLRRSQKPQYVTIERAKSPTKESPTEDEQDDEEEHVDENNTDVASSEEQTISNPFVVDSTLQRATPSYVSIRRARPSISSRNENDVEEKVKDTEGDAPVSSQRRRPGSVFPKSSESSSSEGIVDQESRSPASEQNPQTTKSRYVSVQRFRSTTPYSTEVAPVSQEPITKKSIVSRSEEEEEEEVQKSRNDENVTTTSTTIATSLVTNIVSSTPNDIVIDSETEKPIPTTTPEASSTTVAESTVKLVEDSATEILLTTVPASLPATSSAPSARIGTASVSQPRPFGFNRRNRPSAESTTTPLPPSTDQVRPKVASSEANRLPTLKELIGYRTNERTIGGPSPVILNLLPLENDANRIVEETATFDDASWVLNEEETNYGKLSNDLSVNDIDEYYENDASLASKRRIDRQDSSTTISLKPTTMRGIPLIDLLQSQVPRGFYVTRGEKAENESTLPAESKENVSSKVADKIARTDAFVTDRRYDDVGENSECSTLTPRDLTVKNSKIEDEAERKVTVARESNTDFTETPSTDENDATASIPTSESSVTFSSSSESIVSTLPTENIDFALTSTVTELTQSDDITTKTSMLEPMTETELYLENKTEGTTDENGKNLTKNNEGSKLVPATTVPSASKSIANRRHKIESNPSYEFGRKSQARGQDRYLNNDREDSRTQLSRRRVTSYSYRGRRRRPPSVVTSTVASDVAEETGGATGPVNGTRTNDLAVDRNYGENANEKEKTNLTGGEVERLGTEGSVGRTEPEVNSSKNTIASRTSGNLPSTRLRKPPTINLTTLQTNKTTNTFANHRETSTDDAVDERTETSKPEKEIDQSSKAQEIAMTLADPPSSQTSTLATGRPSFRNALRRKISTTVAPRTDATTNRAVPRFTPTVRDRQKSRSRDNTLQNVTTRPRRPPVIDYDYYEDEEEPVIGKSTFNGKLFLTSKGTFRCLDQGNFPHPYSCKKFITCAKMVNGLVIGAEYTCPDKLSYDPVGGICNWSAGLGCKE